MKGEGLKICSGKQEHQLDNENSRQNKTVRHWGVIKSGITSWEEWMVQEISIGYVRLCVSVCLWWMEAVGGGRDLLGRAISTAVVSVSRSSSRSSSISSGGRNICLCCCALYTAEDLQTLHHKCPSDRLRLKQFKKRVMCFSENSSVRV